MAKKKQQFYVKGNTSVLPPKVRGGGPRKPLTRGATITVGENGFTKQMCERLVKDGVLVPEGGQLAAPSATTITESRKSAPAERDEAAKLNDDTQGLWAEDPAKLKGKSLKELNLLVASKDPEIEPFEDKDEAIGFLSQDFEG